VIRLGPYKAPIEGWIKKAKYERWTEMAELLGTTLGQRVAASGPLDRALTIVAPIPMPWQRRVFRGVDHARIMADAVARTVGVDLHRILSKRNGAVQAGQTATERRRGRRNWMKVKRRWGGWPLNGMHVILVDDVKTTGTTLRTAARLLRGLGAARVTAAVVAVADDPARRSRSLVETK
jgi:ComF family protein